MAPVFVPPALKQPIESAPVKRAVEHIVVLRHDQARIDLAHAFELPCINSGAS